jgi:hypothetical protein
MEKQRLPRIAWFSRFNRDGAAASSSVSAYLTDVSLPIVQQGFEVDLYDREEGHLNNQKIRSYLSALRYHQEDPYSLFFYQLEDSSECNFIKMHMGILPGVTLFHDLLFQSEGPPPLTFSVWPELIKEFNLGLNKVSVKKYPQPDTGPFAYREVALAPISVYSSPRLCSEARRNGKESIARLPQFIGSDKIYLPHPVTVSRHINPVSSDSALPRIGFFGAPSIENRAAKVLQALRDIKAELVWMLPKTDVSRARELTQEYGLLNVSFIEDDSPTGWSKLVPSLDIAIHTFFSMYGSVGPSLPISLAAGVPSVISDYAENDAIPDSVVFKVEPGFQEVLGIRETIQNILELSPVELDVIGANSRNYALENNSVEIVGRELSKVFARAIPALKGFYDRWAEVNRWGRSEVVAANFADYDTSLVGNIFAEMGWR